MINFDISIHAPTRGATDIPGHIHILCGFQSTLPQGERQDTVVTNKPILVISIHAPTRGATHRAWHCGIPHPFQSTLPQGERRNIRPILPATQTHFNPRSHKGSDIPTDILVFVLSIDFNPRSHKGSDRSCNGIIRREHDFNPRSHKGSDSNFTQNSISVLFHIYQSFPYIIFPHTALFRLLIIFCTFFLVRIAQGFPVCFHFAPKQYPAFYNAWSTDLL